jgi:hypothetical protein
MVACAQQPFVAPPGVTMLTGDEIKNLLSGKTTVGFMSAPDWGQNAEMKFSEDGGWSARSLSGNGTAQGSWYVKEDRLFTTGKYGLRLSVGRDANGYRFFHGGGKGDPFDVSK